MDLALQDSHAKGGTSACRQLATTIARRREDILGRWLDRVSAGNRASGIPLTDLQNALPDYLDALVQQLQQSGDLTNESRGTAAWVGVAKEHAVTRIRLGFDISQLVQEFIILRRVLQEVAHEEKALEAIEPSILADLLEAGIAVAVKSYVEARDYSARRTQAENVGFLTHELRNPLNTAKLAAAHLSRTSNPQQARLLELLERNLERLAHLIDGVLHSQRLEVGRIEVHPERISLGDLIGEALSTGQREARSKGLEFNTRLRPELIVELDPILVRSAVQNLIENAVKFTDSGEVSVEVDDLGDEIAIHVRDTCPGISSEELRTIFESFSRGHSNKPGTGLGLSIARRAIDIQGGQLQAESSPDGGCHFWATLPKRFPGTTLNKSAQGV
jgi:signal transduction histidine kinase